MAVQNGGDSLAQGFIAPPDSAKPRVWWHWMNGNVTNEGIDRDLEWMKRIGIGGLQNFDGTFDTPQVIEERLIYMTPPWQEAFRHATNRAEKLGLEFAIASSPGWSETGGPWVEARDGMKKLVWSETRIQGATPFEGVIAEPPSVSGPFQNLPVTDLITGAPGHGPHYYRDVAVLAYQIPRLSLRTPVPVTISTSAPEIDAATLAQSQSLQLIVLPLAQDAPAWVQYDFGTAHRLRAASLCRARNLSLMGLSWIIQGSDDGIHFRRLTEFPDEPSLRHTTVEIPPVTARYVRLTIREAPSKSWFQYAANAPGAGPVPEFMRSVREVALYSLQFYAGARVHRFEEKAGFVVAPNYYELDSAPCGEAETIEPQGVVDLTGRLSADGTLHWNAPPGEWKVLRIGYSLTGKTNHPASPEATGLEVDKLDRNAVKAYLDHYLGNFEKTVGRDWMGKRGIRAFVTDSIECQGQNWTASMREEFTSRRGYDPTCWLPALTGVIIGNAARTDLFLWDFRKTLIELITEAHYGQIAASVHAREMIYYSESLEGYPTYALGDDLDMRAPADIPMAAIWTNYKAEERDGILNHIGDMRGAASVAHFYGRPIVAVEALTSGYEPWAFCPANLKPVIDLAFALGINRPVIHTSVHQPVERRPGMSLGPYGQHFTRHETWAEMAEPWVTYLSRCAYLLQQGKHVADVAWFYGEEGSLAGLYAERTPADLPQGYGFDFINANMLVNHMRVSDGLLTSSGGARYRFLYLGGTSERMTLAVLRKVKLLSDQGVPIAGRRPRGSPSLADENHQEEYQRLIAELWDHGNIMQDLKPNEALERLGISRDCDYTAPSADSSILFSHRILEDGEIYFITNRKARAELVKMRFRVTGKKPEIWRADTGEFEAVSWRAEPSGTLVTLALRNHESAFVIFRELTSQTVQDVPAPKDLQMLCLDGEWALSFESERGAPQAPHNTLLGSWADSPEAGIKYFSGIGTYSRSFTIEHGALEGSGKLLLNLGRVHELAEVVLNDKAIGTAWHAPFEVDATEAIKSGINHLEIRVANLWVNRLIGDRQPGAVPVAFTVTSTYEPDAPLRPSGLLGPVTLVRRV
jgi:hypothetical protein